MRWEFSAEAMGSPVPARSGAVVRLFGRLRRTRNDADW